MASAEDPDRKGLELELDLDTRGWLMCECFSRWAPEGEFGPRSDQRLYPIGRDDFERALQLLEERDIPVYEEHVYHAFVRSLERLIITSGSRPPWESMIQPIEAKLRAAAQ